MIKLLAPVPHYVEVACSGGVDSMAVCSFLDKMRIQYHPIFFNHGTKNSDKAEKFLREKYGDGVYVGNISRAKLPSESWEEYWRKERNKFFESRKHLYKGKQSIIVTAHHLDDAVETYVWSALHGTPKLPLYYNGLVYRPFLLNKKSEFIKWAKDKHVDYVEDESNKDIRYTRNFIRHNLMPNVLRVNPGIHKVVAKKILKSFQERGLDKNGLRS
jgi:tRNA(Ile)-lysidine synthase